MIGGVGRGTPPPGTRLATTCGSSLPPDTGDGSLVRHLKMAVAYFMLRPLLGHGDNHRLERINVVQKLCKSCRHRLLKKNMSGDGEYEA